MFYSLLETAADTAANDSNQWTKYLLVGFLAVLVVGAAIWFIFSGRKNKQRQKEYVEQIEAIQPVIIETGSEKSGKSYVKMDKELIAQTDAKGPTQIAREEAEAKKKAEKEAKQAGKTEPAEPEAPAESAEPEAPAEPAAEEKPEEKE